jgi:transposase-like protein
LIKQAYLIPKERVEHDAEVRVRESVKDVLEERLSEERTEHLKAGYRERTPTRRDECNGHYQRNLVMPTGKIERLEVPSDGEAEFVIEIREW